MIKFKYVYIFLYYCWQKPGRFINFFKFGTLTSTEVVVNDQKKVVYVLNPKVATSTFRYFLANEDVSKIKQEHSMKKKKAMQNIVNLRSKNCCWQYKKNGYFVFSYVRNPYDRLISFFENKYKAGEDGMYYARAFAFKKGLEKVDSFDDMVRKICEIPDQLADAHFISQYKIIESCGCIDAYSLLGKIENFDATSSELYEKISDGQSIPKRNQSKEKGIKNQVYFNEELKELVLSRYRKDFEMFGYSFD